MGVIFSLQVNVTTRRQVWRHFPLNLKKKLQKKTGLITAKELKDELDISGTTLKNWMDIGLVSYQSPFESSKKLYFKVSDVINFLTIR